MPETLVPGWCVPGVRVVVYPRAWGVGLGDEPASFVSRVSRVSERVFVVPASPDSGCLWLFPYDGLELRVYFDCGWVTYRVVPVNSPEGRAAVAAVRSSDFDRRRVGYDSVGIVISQTRS